MKKFLATAALALSALTANAELVHIGATATGTLVLDKFEYSPISANVQLGSFTPFSVNAGGLSAIYNGLDPYVVYCVEILSPAYLDTAIPYIFGFAADDAFSKLFTLNGGAETDNKFQSAGMQLAIWELLYDENPVNVSTGTFRTFLPVGNTAATLYANYLLANLEYVKAEYDIKLFSDNASGKTGKQDFITATHSVPEPSTFGLAGLGFLGLALRKKA